MPKLYCRLGIALQPFPRLPPRPQGIDGKDIKMDRFKGKVLLVINVASACGERPPGWQVAAHAACFNPPHPFHQPDKPSPTRAGFTPQYTEMSQLYDKYASKGLEVLAFPCNQVGLVGFLLAPFLP